MKLSLTTYSLAGAMRSGRLSQTECIAWAKNAGYTGIEFVDMPQFGAIDKSTAPVIREECEKVGIPVVSFTFGADFLNGSGGDTEAEIARVCEKLDIAALLGTPLVRHDASTGSSAYRSFDAALPVLAGACRQVTEYAASLGICTTVENHGRFCQDSDRVERLYNAVAHDNFGLLVDIGNFLCADEDPFKAVSRVAPYAKHCHIKDFHIRSAGASDPGRGFFRSRGGAYLRGAIAGQGDVDVAACIMAMRFAGYNGYASVEFEGVEDCIYALEVSAETIGRLLG